MPKGRADLAMRFDTAAVPDRSRGRAQADVDLVVLTDVEEFHAALKETVTEQQRIWRVPSADQAAELLAAGRVGVLVIDTESLPRGAPELITQLNHEFPDLVVVVAGTHDEAPQFARLVSEGFVYRFLQKPVSTARVRAFIDAAVRRHRELLAEAPTAVLSRARRRTPRLARWALWAFLLAAAFVGGLRLLAPGKSAGPQERHAAPATQTLPAPGQAARPADAAATIEPRTASESPALIKPRAAATPAEPPEPSVRAAPSAIEQHEAERPAPQIAGLLRQARAALDAGMLVEPQSQSARDLIAAALKLDPQSTAARAALTDLQNRVIERAQTSIAQSDPSAASTWIDQAQQLGVAASDLTALRNAQTDRVKRIRADRLAGLARLAAQRLAEDKLIEPADDSAQQYVKQLENEDPAMAAPLRQQLTDRLLAKARNELSRGELDAADRWLGRVEETGVDSSEATTVRAQLQSARARAAFLADVIPSSRLKQVRYVAPTYPRKALDQGLEGWVDLEFTVDASGAIRDIVVRNAVPTGVFEQAAVEALARWRYQPAQHDGKPANQRAAVRVQFKVAQ